MNALEKALHQRALDIARSYRKAEADLLEILQKLDEKKVFRALGYSSLFQYAVSELKLSEANAFNFITVARKATEVPALKVEIKAGNLSVAKARKITPVIQAGNASEWIEKAKALPKPLLEKEVAKVIPKVLTPEKSRYVSENRLSVQLGINEDLHRKLNRVKDLLSQKLRKAASLEDALNAMADLYLDREDPVEKAKRAKEKKPSTKLSEKHPEPVVFTPVHGQAEKHAISSERRALPSAVKHEVMLRDEGQCTHRGGQGERCGERRWLDMHHVISKAHGGPDAADNLQLLCFHHHRARHETLSTGSG